MATNTAVRSAIAIGGSNRQRKLSKGTAKKRRNPFSGPDRIDPNVARDKLIQERQSQGAPNFIPGSVLGLFETPSQRALRIRTSREAVDFNNDKRAFNRRRSISRQIGIGGVNRGLAIGL